jgi:hypothetical protein
MFSLHQLKGSWVTHLDDLQLQRDEALEVPLTPNIRLVVLERRRVGQPRLEDVDEEGQPLLEDLVGEALDHALVVLHDHLEDVEAAAEHAARQRAQHRTPLLVDGHIEEHLDELRRDAEEGGLVEAVLDELAQHLERAVQLAVGRDGDELQQVVEQVGPLVGVVGVGNLAHDEARGGLELAVELVRGREGQQLLPYGGLVLLGDEQAALVLLEALAPAGQHQLLEVQQRGLADVERHIVVAGDADEPEGQLLVAVVRQQLLLGVLARALLRRLGRGEQLH